MLYHRSPTLQKQGNLDISYSFELTVKAKRNWLIGAIDYEGHPQVTTMISGVAYR